MSDICNQPRGQETLGLLTRFRRSKEGSVVPIVAFGLLLVIPTFMTAMDYSRASSLQQKAQEAATVAVREANRGKSDAEVYDYVYAQLEPWMQQNGYAGGRGSIHPTLKRDAQGRAKLNVRVDYEPMLVSAYRVDDVQIEVGANATADVACVSPAEETRWISDRQACPTGMIGDHTWEAEQSRLSYCLAPTGTAFQWDPWSDTGRKRNEVNTCAPPCAPLAPETRWTDQSASCQTGYVGANTWQREERRTSSCPAATGSPVWSSWSVTGATRNVSNTCRPACSTSSQERWVSASGSCSAGYAGSRTWESREVRYSTCASPEAEPVWGSYVATGETRNVQDTCALLCSPAPAETRWERVDVGCPAGQVGSNYYDRKMARTSYCPATTGSPTWNSWYDTGERQNVVNTCVPSWPSGTCRYDSKNFATINGLYGQRVTFNGVASDLGETITYILDGTAHVYSVPTYYYTVMHDIKTLQDFGNGNAGDLVNYTAGNIRASFYDGGNRILGSDGRWRDNVVYAPAGVTGTNRLVYSPLGHGYRDVTTPPWPVVMVNGQPNSTRWNAHLLGGKMRYPSGDGNYDYELCKK